jgi:hypothetical protein
MSLTAPRLRAPRTSALLCALLLAACTLAALPFAEVGLDDDFSYVHSAKTLAQTGHIVYVGWASAMLGWQLPLGALFIKLFGFSFSATRASVLVVSMLTAYLLQRTMVRFGLRDWNATLATLTFVLSPLFMPLAFSFMSDIPGVFVTVLCLYACIRAVQAEGDRAAFGWLVFASLSNAIGGTARQTAWFGVLLMVPSTFWLIRKRRPPMLVAALVWLVSLGILYGSMRWFSLQPYSLREKVVAGYVDRDLLYAMLGNIARSTSEMFLFLLPVLVAFVARYPWQNKRIVRNSAIAIVVLCLLALYLGHTHHLVPWLAPFGVDGSFVSPGGLVDVPEIGHRPQVMQPWFQGLVTIATVIGAIAFLGFLANWAKDRRLEVHEESRFQSFRAPTWKEVFILLGPFTLGYVGILMHRAIFGTVFDRYLLPILPIALILIVRFYQETIGETSGDRLPAVSVVVLVLFTLFGIAGTHDVFATRRARVQAGDRLIAAGIPRTAFYGGFEYDGWTQIEAMGFINSGYMLMPDGFHPVKPIPREMKVKPCDDRFAQNDPAIQPKYGLSFDEQTCDGPSEFPPVTYRAWLPPFTREIYIRKVTRPAF